MKRKSKMREKREKKVLQAKPAFSNEEQKNFASAGATFCAVSLPHGGLKKSLANFYSIPFLWHKSEMTHSPHFGFRAVQTYRPCKIKW